MTTNERNVLNLPEARLLSDAVKNREAEQRFLSNCNAAELEMAQNIIKLILFAANNGLYCITVECINAPLRVYLSMMGYTVQVDEGTFSNAIISW